MDEKWGYIDKTGKIVIEPTFDGAGPFSEGLTWVKTNNKYGFIDKTGKLIIETQKYTFVSLFSEGLALVVTGQNKQNMYLRDQLYTISISSRNPSLPVGRMFFIDKTGKTIIDLQDLGVKTVLLVFSEGLVGVKIGLKWGFIDQTGKVVIELKYDVVWPFTHGLAKVVIDGKYGYINKSGKYIWVPSK
jgi:hypothetical protein